MFEETRPASTTAIVEYLKNNNQDYEWYPTTNEILDTIKKDLEEEYIHSSPSVLDCGAGDGRSLMYLTNGDRYAIEKSEPLIQSMDRSIYIVGTEFREQTLIDKKVNVIFCNPPYSEYEEWMKRIIKEANAEYLYFVVPSRWEDNANIAEVLKLRDAETTCLGSFDFHNAERSARAKVQILRIEMGYSRYHRHGSKTDPFDIWFKENFELEINKRESSKYDLEKNYKSSLKTNLNKELVTGNDIVKALEKLYLRDLEKLIKNYKSLQEIDAELLRELDVNLDSVKAALRQKIEGLKDTYWQELFNSLDKITCRLTQKTRETMLDKLTSYTHVDFTVANAYAVLIWVLKNANIYLDDQLVNLVERMTEQANIRLYTSNKNTFGDENWRYGRTPCDLDRYRLDYRIVLHRIGGIHTSEWRSWQAEKYNGLEDRAYHFINDILTIANNIGFDVTNCEKANSYQWESNKACTFDYHDHRTGKHSQLMHVRAFKNGNLHIKFNQAFICRLNVEFGRLKGWLKSPKDAVHEMDVSHEVALACFASNLQLTSDNMMKLEFQSAA